MLPQTASPAGCVAVGVGVAGGRVLVAVGATAVAVGGTATVAVGGAGVGVTALIVGVAVPPGPTCRHVVGSANEFTAATTSLIRTFPSPFWSAFVQLESGLVSRKILTELTISLINT